MRRALAAARALLAGVVFTATLAGASLLAPAPAVAATRTYTATTSVNLRSGPSTAKTILTQLQAGQTVLAAGGISGDWLPVAWDGGTAYAWASYFRKDATPADVVLTGPTGRRTTSAVVNVRAAASLDAAITKIVEERTPLKVTGLSSGDFAQVALSGTPQWVHARFLSSSTDTTPEVVATYTTTGKLALRSTASVAATNLKNLPIGTEVGSTGTHSGGYTQVVHAGQLGWVVTGYLKAADGTPEEFLLPLRKATWYVLGSGVTLRATADATGTAVATLREGDLLRGTGSTKAGFTQVIWNGGTSWVATASLSATQPVLDLGTPSLNKLEPNGKKGVLEVRANFPRIKTIYGWRSSSSYSSDHPNGRAIDIMIPSYKANRALGDDVAAYFIEHGRRLNVSYIIWRQRSYTLARGSWRKMADRGGDTANHMDHVHVSFEPS